MGKRLNYLDIAKAIGIVLVMMGHSCGFIFGGDYISSFYMMMFFVASGYVYKASDLGYGERIVRRFKRIMIPYIVYNILLLAYYLLKETVSGDLNLEDSLMAVLGVVYSRNHLYVDAAENVFFFRMLNDPVWFLTAMMSASVIFYAVVDICLKDRRAAVAIIIGLMVLTVAMSCLPILLPWSIDSAPLFAVGMIIGAMLGRIGLFEAGLSRAGLSETVLSDKEGSLSSRIIEFLVYAVLFILSVALRYYNGSVNMSVRVYGDRGIISPVLVLFISVTGSVVMLYVCRWIEKLLGARVTELIVMVGRNTMAIMALHMAIFQLIDKVAMRILENLMSYSLVYWAYGAVKIIVAIVICILVEKTKDYIIDKIKR